MDIVTYALLNGKIKDYASNVDKWLEENVDPTTGYVLDRSLQMENAAAPADMVGDINDDVGDLKNTLNHKADLIYDTASGDIASFPDGADGLPVKDLTVAIEPVQDTSGGDPSPTHICPISGWTGCNISHSGADTSDPTVIPISWQSEAGTVYGGMLELPSCVLTVDRARVVFDGTQLVGKSNWEANAESVGWLYEPYHTPGIQNDRLDDSNLDLIISDKLKTLKYVGSSGIYGATISSISLVGTSSWGVVMRVNDPTLTNNNAINAYLSSNPVTVVYKLATPQTYQLDPVTVTTLLGQNNIWVDCGPSTVEYPADTKLYIQKINTPTDDDMIADANIASGQYFIVNNNLYLSTAAILAGDPIKPGTNCTATNLAAALNALNS